MLYRQLLSASKAHLEKFPGPLPTTGFSTLFTNGAEWMHNRLNEIKNEPLLPFNKAVPYEYYGWLKYGLCVFVFVCAGMLLAAVHVWLLPVAILFFYLAEVHFLFLFPLLIIAHPYPVRKSIFMAYQTGIGKAVFTVIPIAVYMVMGLLNKRKPFKNWYIGSLAILIWYVQETNNRLSSPF